MPELVSSLLPGPPDECLALDVLEARVADLEARVMGARPVGAAQSPAGSGNPPAAESLCSAHALLQSATAGRDKAAAVLHRRLPELEDYLSAAVGGSAGPAAAAATADAQWELVLREEPTLRTAARDLRRLAELQPALDPRPLRDVPELEPRLRELAAAVLDNRTASQMLAKQVAALRGQQQEALDHLSQGVALLEIQLAQLEAASQPRRRAD